MQTATTHDITVSVETFFQPEQSRAGTGFLFAYRIRIENNGRRPVQLMRRHWHIAECTGETREVEGEGVVGRTPVISPGGVHEYTSACSLIEPMGQMRGTYLMRSTDDGEVFRVQIPAFLLVAPFMLN